jgi:hypothetical protein
MTLEILEACPYVTYGTVDTKFHFRGFGTNSVSHLIKIYVHTLSGYCGIITVFRRGGIDSGYRSLLRVGRAKNDDDQECKYCSCIFQHAVRQLLAFIQIKRVGDIRDGTFD